MSASGRKDARIRYGFVRLGMGSAWGLTNADKDTEEVCARSGNFSSDRIERSCLLGELGPQYALPAFLFRHELDVRAANEDAELDVLPDEIVEPRPRVELERVVAELGFGRYRVLSGLDVCVKVGLVRAFAEKLAVHVDVLLERLANEAVPVDVHPGLSLRRGRKGLERRILRGRCHGNGSAARRKKHGCQYGEHGCPEHTFPLGRTVL